MLEEMTGELLRTRTNALAHDPVRFLVVIVLWRSYVFVSCCSSSCNYLVAAAAATIWRSHVFVSCCSSSCNYTDECRLLLLQQLLPMRLAAMGMTAPYFLSVAAAAAATVRCCQHECCLRTAPAAAAATETCSLAAILGLTSCERK